MTITPKQFMTQPEPDEAELVDPLESIAESLRVIAGQQSGTEADVTAAEMHEALFEQGERLADLNSKHAELYALLEEIEALLKPSTSKLANSVRAAINAWRAPEVPAGPRVDAPPEHDADVEVWREYAVLEGLPRADAEGLNRSQIRTALGIEQPA